MLNGKGMIIFLTVGLIKKDTVYMSGYFSEPKPSGGRVKVELDLSNYAKKSRFKKCNRCRQTKTC